MTSNYKDGYARFQRCFAKYKFHYHFQEGLCFYCRQPMALPHPDQSGTTLPPDRVTLEHLIPRKRYRGIKQRIRNCRVYRMMPKGERPQPHRNHVYHTVAACNHCNRERSDTNWQTFLLRKIEDLWAPK